MRRQVLLTLDAERDLADIYEYVLQSDGSVKADYVLGRMLAATEKLAEEGLRGSFPPELRSLGIQEYCQVFFEPYRISGNRHKDRHIHNGRRQARYALLVVAPASRRLMMLTIHVSAGSLSWI